MWIKLVWYPAEIMEAKVHLKCNLLNANGVGRYGDVNQFKLSIYFPFQKNSNNKWSDIVWDNYQDVYYRIFLEKSEWQTFVQHYQQKPKKYSATII